MTSVPTTSHPTLCIVCSNPLKAGLAPWHHLCSACGYEGSSLEPVINDPAAHMALDEGLRETGLRALRTDNFRQITSVVRPLSKSPRPLLLDVGAAHGWFLDEASKEFDVLGVEPDAIVAANTAARGVSVRVGYFPEALGEEETFDVIVFNDVIEHIPSIQGALDACAERLNSDGLLVLNLPNSAGMFYRLSRFFSHLGWKAPFARLWQRGLPSPHVHYFNRKNLTTLVSRHGFSVVREFELPSVRFKGLSARLRCTDPSIPRFVFLYLGMLAVIPLTWAFPSDAIVCVYRKTNVTGTLMR